MMHVGCQYFSTDPASMQFLQRFGVKHIDVRVPDMELETQGHPFIPMRTTMQPEHL